jgi:hypothetical protein
MKYTRFLTLLLFLVSVIFPLRGEDGAETIEKKPPVITIEESNTSVWWYAVFLNVKDLVEEENQLLGSYSIRLPSRSKNNEDGKVILQLEKPLKEILHQRAKIKGIGVSNNPKHPHREIVCEFWPDPRKPGSGRVRMTIDTQERVLHFHSTYSLPPAN